MDVVVLLKNAILQLPNGEYTTGLSATLRHIQAAIRHFDRNKLEEPDSFTDAIYRTNQAYEGSLKEAYRVLAGHDPSKLSTFEIEQYLEKNNVIRPKVVTQLTRYRQDYCNPSTHDYKLDFDENEALLTILAVTAFSKLLVDQIYNKVALDTAIEDIKTHPVEGDKITGAKPEQYLRSMADSVAAYLNSVSHITSDESRETARVAAYLEAQGVRVFLNETIDTSNRWLIEWDVIANIDDNNRVAFDIKSSRGRQSDNITKDRIEKLFGWLHQSELSYGVLLEGVARGEKYFVTKFTQDTMTVYRVGKKV